MTPIDLRVVQKFVGKSVIAALASIPHVFGRYWEARKSLRGSISRQSRQGLDWMNFFLADVQTAFGAFIAFYLADLGWSKGQVGLALTVGTLAAVISQIPGGALVDTLRWKRGLTAIGIGTLCLSALIFALMPSFVLVFVAEILHHGRHSYAGDCGYQPWSRWPASNVSSDWSQLSVQRRGQCPNGRPHGISRPVFCQERHIFWRCHVVHPGAHCAEPNSRRRN